MEFQETPKVQELKSKLLDFMDSHVYPAEGVYREQVEKGSDRHVSPPVMEDL